MIRPDHDTHAPIHLVGVPVDIGAGQKGASMGPAALRLVGLVETLEGLGLTVRDLGDVTPARETMTGDRRAQIAGWCHALAERSYGVMREGAFPIFLGGDHSLSIGSVSGIARHCAETGRPLFVLWLDAHGDFNTPSTSPSGNIHGMPAAFLCGEEGFDGIVPDAYRAPVDPTRVHLFGIRSLDSGERALLRARGVDVADMRLIDEYGVAALLRRIIERVTAAEGHLHVSLDIDFLDPSFAPAVGTAVPGGATYREAHLIMEMLHDSGVVGSLDIVELNPILDERGRSARTLVDLTASLLGRRVLDTPARSPRA